MADDIKVSPAEANEKIVRGEAVLLDVVGESTWRSLRQVPAGAIRLSPGDAAAFIGRLPQGRAFAVFCT